MTEECEGSLENGYAKLKWNKNKVSESFFGPFFLYLYKLDLVSLPIFQIDLFLLMCIFKWFYQTSLIQSQTSFYYNTMCVKIVLFTTLLLQGYVTGWKCNSVIRGVQFSHKKFSKQDGIALLMFLFQKKEEGCLRLDICKIVHVLKYHQPQNYSTLNLHTLEKNKNLKYCETHTKSRMCTIN